MFQTALRAAAALALVSLIGCEINNPPVAATPAPSSVVVQPATPAPSSVVVQPAAPAPSSVVVQPSPY